MSTDRDLAHEADMRALRVAQLKAEVADHGECEPYEPYPTEE